jgi:hypothetical protein
MSACAQRAMARCLTAARMTTPPSDFRRGLARGLVVAMATLGALGLFAEVLNHRWHRPGLEPLIAFLSLSFERNLPTWYASSLLLACAVALAAVAIAVVRPGDAFRRHWWGLAIIFGYMSLDEAVSLHEHLGGLFRLRGVLYFSWVVPAAALVALFGLSYLRFVLKLPPGTRRRFVTAGVVYVGGALFMELPLGWWTERAGDENLGYALIDWVEEMLELGGATLFLLAILRHLAEHLARTPRVAPARAAASAE